MNRAVLATVLTLASTAVFAAGTGTSAGPVSATAKVKIRKAITLVKTADLDFGGIVISGVGTGDTAVLSPANVLTAPGTNGTIVGTFNTTSPAAFNVGGTKSATYSVTLPAAPITMTGPGGGVTVGAFASTSGSGSNTLDAVTGADTLAVGATLTVPAATVDGDYTAPFSVTVAYN